MTFGPRGDELLDLGLLPSERLAEAHLERLELLVQLRLLRTHRLLQLLDPRPQLVGAHHLRTGSSCLSRLRAGALWSAASLGGHSSARGLAERRGLGGHATQLLGERNRSDSRRHAQAARRHLRLLGASARAAARVHAARRALARRPYGGGGGGARGRVSRRRTRSLLARRGRRPSRP